MKSELKFNKGEEGTVRIIIIIALAAIIPAGCSSNRPAQYVAAPAREVVNNPVSITAQEIVAEGMGVADRSLPENQQKYLSKQAAVVDAERNIRRAIEAYIESEITTDRGIVESDRVKERVTGVIRGGELVTVVWDNPATCQVTMKITKEKMQQLVDWVATLR